MAQFQQLPATGVEQGVLVGWVRGAFAADRDERLVSVDVVQVIAADVLGVQATVEVNGGTYPAHATLHDQGDALCGNVWEVVDLYLVVDGGGGE